MHYIDFHVANTIKITIVEHLRNGNRCYYDCHKGWTENVRLLLCDHSQQFWVHPLLALLSGPGAQFLVLLRSIHYKCCLPWLHASFIGHSCCVLCRCCCPLVCINVFVCGGNESGTENWSLQNSLLFNEPCQTKLGLKILLTWIEALILGVRVGLFVTDITVTFSTSTSIYCSSS